LTLWSDPKQQAIPSITKDEQLSIDALAGTGALSTTFRGGLSSTSTPVIAKIVDLDSFDLTDDPVSRDYTKTEAREAIIREWRIYQSMTGLQGQLVPRCYGLFHSSRFFVLLLEDVGREIGQQVGEKVEVGGGDDRAEESWHGIKPSIRYKSTKEALPLDRKLTGTLTRHGVLNLYKNLHSHGVVHHDIETRHLRASPEKSLKLIDFDQAEDVLTLGKERFAVEVRREVLLLKMRLGLD